MNIKKHLHAGWAVPYYIFIIHTQRALVVSETLDGSTTVFGQLASTHVLVSSKHAELVEFADIDKTRKLYDT